MGALQTYLCQFTKALSFYKEAKLIYKTNKNQLGLIRVSLSLAKLYNKQNDLKNAILCCEQALKLAQSLNLLQEEGMVLYEMAKLDVSQQQWRFAKYKYEKAICLFNQTNDYYLKGSSWIKLGIVERALGNYEQAFACFQSVCHAEAPYNSTLIGIAFHQLGILEIWKKNYKKGDEYYKKSLHIFLGQNFKAPLARLYISLAALTYKKGNLDESLKYLEESLHIFKAVQNTLWEVVTLLLISSIYREKGDSEKGNDFLAAAKKIQKGMGVSIRNGNVLNMYDFT